MNNPYCKQFPTNTVIIDTLPNDVNFGALINGSMPTSSKIAILNSLGGLIYTRDAINLSNYPQNNSHGSYDDYIAAGKKVLVNLNWDKSTLAPVPFPTNMVLYGAKINAVLDDIATPEVIVIENEEFNHNYHLDPELNYTKYVTMVQTASPIAHARGYKITDGGLGAVGLDICTYRYLKATYGQSEAYAFGVKSMRQVQITAANNPGSNADLDAKANLIQGVLDGCKDYVDYFNVHSYEVNDPRITDLASVKTITPGVFAKRKEFIETTTGVPVISNETGVRYNYQPDLVTSMMLDYNALNVPYIIWFDGVGSAGAVPLNDQFYPYKLNPGGEAFKNVMINVQS